MSEYIFVTNIFKYSNIFVTLWTKTDKTMWMSGVVSVLCNIVPLVQSVQRSDQWSVPSSQIVPRHHLNHQNIISSFETTFLRDGRLLQLHYWLQQLPGWKACSTIHDEEQWHCLLVHSVGYQWCFHFHQTISLKGTDGVTKTDEFSEKFQKIILQILDL